ncbi:hypothetical protein KFE96_03070 [Kordiimonas sp. SCSIO 12603]|uniref:hypothetical protein n=1 Tax=Kordiimonas sp. SCSIO 12603 TaxID=2829596 RepID=UPI0021049A0C|nr:hypothetical protein [Kordiimonas sp. SCSIO 12603]UTW59305.1 hypothetical protein KFE96_03070 [Kordiimonas sp. SCSIO 12603]
MKSEATKDQNKLVLLSMKALLSVVSSKLAYADVGGISGIENKSALEATRRRLQARIKALEASHSLAPCS